MNVNKGKSPRSISRIIKNILKSRLHSVFAAGQKFGFDVLPRHFYSEIPDLRNLKNTNSWRSPFSMTGILGTSFDEQVSWIGETVHAQLRKQLAQGDIYRQACLDNGEEGYGQIEAEFLHCFIQRYKPKNILQVGCGVSTAVCLRAANGIPYQQRIICVEPYPTPFLKRCCDEGKIELIRKKLQDVNPTIVSELEEGDLFFVDSSHALGPAGEVTRIVLEFLPRMGKNAFAHFHDIYFPYDYQGGLLNDALFFGHESALLMALLTLNNQYRIMASFSMLHHGKQDELTKLFANYVPAKYVDGLRTGPGHFPSSIFIRRLSD